jgi:tetratricopeptide (TPR) repeat protein
MLCAGLFFGTVLLYAPTARFELTGYDDFLYVQGKQVQPGLTIDGVRWAFGIGEGRHYFEPLSWISHMAAVQVFGQRPGAHHLVNVVIHAAAAVALLLALVQLTGALWPSATTAALFAWHPLHVGSVAWVAERKDVLSGLGFAITLMTYAWYARRPTVGRYLALFACFAVALMTKPMLVTVPCVLLLLDYWPLKRFHAPGRVIAEKIPLLALSAAACIASVKIQFLDAAIRSGATHPLPLRLGNALVSYVRYLYKTAVPVRLSIFYPYEVWSAWQIAASAGLLIAITVAVILQRCSRPHLLVGWLWFVGMLVPVIGIVQSGSQSMADRYTYLPLIGVFIMVCWSIRWTRESRIAAGVVLMACCGLSLYQLQFWKNDFTLFSRALEATENNHLAHGYVGKSLADRHDDQEAQEHYQRALEINPQYWETHYNLGNLLLRQGRTQDAIAHYSETVRLQPKFPDALNNLGIAQASQADWAAAEQSFRAAAEAAPDRVDIAQNLARVRQRR